MSLGVVIAGSVSVWEEARSCPRSREGRGGMQYLSVSTQGQHTNTFPRIFLLTRN